MPPEFPSFKSMEPADRDLIAGYSHLAPHGICEYSFANLMIWRDFDRPAFTFINDNLCILINPLDEPSFFLQPLGTNDLHCTLKLCVQHAGRASRVSADFVAGLPHNSFAVKPLPDHFDYLYRASDLAELKGRRYDGKRNHIRRFERMHPQYEYVKLEKKHGPEALALFDEWSLEKKKFEQAGDEQRDLAYACQRDAIARAFEYFDELNLAGGAIVVGSAWAGFAIGSASSADTACMHFCYSRPGLTGAFQTMMRDACRNVFAGFKIINLEQDLGLPGLRKTKFSYHPLKVEEKFHLEMNIE